MIILKIIGVLLLIILILLVIALCIPVCVGVKYDNTVTLTLKYLFLRFDKEFGGEQSAQSEQAVKEPTVFEKILKKVSGFLKKSWGAVKTGCKKAKGAVKRAYRKIKAKLKTQSKARKGRKKQGSGGGKSSETKTSEQSLFGSLREERGFWGAIEFFVDLGKMFGGCFVKIYRGIAANKFVLRAEIVGEDAADTAIKYGGICSVVFPMLSILLSNMRRYSQDIEITPNFDGEEGRIYFDGEFVVFPIIVIGHALGAVIKFAWKQIKITLKNQKKK